VVPVFLEQAAAKRPLTVTVPEMTRFVMRIDEALDLVEYAIGLAEPGDLFVHRAPSVRLDILAEAVRALWGKDATVKVVGRREGEKDSETLITREEMARAVDMGKFFRIPADWAERKGGKSNAKAANGASLTSPDAYTSDVARLLDVAEIAELLKQNELVREALAGAPG
jgi:UDP-N-acetylglucosamine 4,6-dehydratase